MLVKDIMTKNVITVNNDTTLKELTRIISTYRINGAPVVDRDGILIGVITMTDLLRILRHICFWDEVSGREKQEGNIPQIKDALCKEKDRAIVGSKMTTSVYTVKETDTVDYVLQLMCKYDIHTIPVVNDGKLVGIVGATDIVNSCI